MTFCVLAIIPLERAVLDMIGGLMILKQEPCSEVTNSANHRDHVVFF